MVKLDGERDPNKCSYKQDYYKDQEGKCVFQIKKKKKKNAHHSQIKGKMSTDDSGYPTLLPPLFRMSSPASSKQ